MAVRQDSMRQLTRRFTGMTFDDFELSASPITPTRHVGNEAEIAAALSGRLRRRGTDSTSNMYVMVMAMN